jgi:hypothetical protein
MPELLKRSTHAVEAARTKDAIDLALRAMARDTLSRADAESALHLAGKFADTEAFRGVFQGYVNAMGGKAPPAVEEGLPNAPERGPPLARALARARSATAETLNECCERKMGRAVR